jgi:hypothetical protein
VKITALHSQDTSRVQSGYLGPMATVADLAKHSTYESSISLHLKKSVPVRLAYIFTRDQQKVRITGERSPLSANGSE